MDTDEIRICKCGECETAVTIGDYCYGCWRSLWGRGKCSVHNTVVEEEGFTFTLRANLAQGYRREI